MEVWDIEIRKAFLRVLLALCIVYTSFEREEEVIVGNCRLVHCIRVTPLLHVLVLLLNVVGEGR